MGDGISEIAANMGDQTEVKTVNVVPCQQPIYISEDIKDNNSEGIQNKTNYENMSPIMLARPAKFEPPNHSLVTDTKISAIEAPEVATFKMVGIKELVTVSNAPKNWSIEQETKFDETNELEDN